MRRQNEQKRSPARISRYPRLAASNICSTSLQPTSNSWNRSTPRPAWTLAISTILFVFSCVETTTGQEASSTPSLSQDNSHARLAAAKQKISLLERMLRQPDIVDRISRASNQEAKAGIDRAHGMLKQSYQLVLDNRANEAAETADEGLRAISLAASLVSSAERQSAAARAAYIRSRDKIVLYVKTIDDMKLKGNVNETTLSHYNLVTRKIETALEQSEKAAATDPGGALAILDPVSKLVEETINNARYSRTLVYSISFATPEEEYQYERVRNESYERLIDALVEKGNLSDATKRILEAVVKRNESSRTNTDAALAAGRFEDALSELTASTERLINTLKIAGLNFN